MDNPIGYVPGIYSGCVVMSAHLFISVRNAICISCVVCFVALVREAPAHLGSKPADATLKYGEPLIEASLVGGQDPSGQSEDDESFIRVYESRLGRQLQMAVYYLNEIGRAVVYFEHDWSDIDDSVVDQLLNINAVEDVFVASSDNVWRTAEGKLIAVRSTTPGLHYLVVMQKEVEDHLDSLMSRVLVLTYSGRSGQIQEAE